MSVQCVFLYTERKSQHKHTFHILVSVVRWSFPPEFRFLQHIIFRFSSFSRILAGNSVIYCGSDWGTFGSSSNSKLCQSTRSFFCLFFFFNPPPPSPSISLTHSQLASMYLCPSRWRCEIFKRTLLLGDNALQQMGHRRTDPNVCKSPYKAAQDVFNITQVPQALF